MRVLVDFYVNAEDVAFGVFMLGTVFDKQIEDLQDVQLNQLGPPPPLDTLAVYDVRTGRRMCELIVLKSLPLPPLTPL